MASNNERSNKIRKQHKNKTDAHKLAKKAALLATPDTAHGNSCEAVKAKLRDLSEVKRLVA